MDCMFADVAIYAVRPVRPEQQAVTASGADGAPTLWRGARRIRGPAVLFGRVRIRLLWHPCGVLLANFFHVEGIFVPPDRAAFALLFFEMRARSFQVADELGDFGFVHGGRRLNLR